jgi:hypothetical protein
MYLKGRVLNNDNGVDYGINRVIFNWCYILLYNSTYNGNNGSDGAFRSSGG